MPKLNIEKKHALGAAEARKRLDTVATKLSEKYGLKSTWKSETQAEVKGTGASGTISVGSDKVTVFIDLSFALTPLKSKIEEKVHKELDAALV